MPSTYDSSLRLSIFLKMQQLYQPCRSKRSAYNVNTGSSTAVWSTPTIRALSIIEKTTLDFEIISTNKELIRRHITLANSLIFRRSNKGYPIHEAQQLFVVATYYKCHCPSRYGYSNQQSSCLHSLCSFSTAVRCSLWTRSSSPAVVRLNMFRAIFLAPSMFGVRQVDSKSIQNARALQESVQRT